MARRPKGYDLDCWQRMSEGEREATTAMERALTKAKARRDRSFQTLQNRYRRRLREIVQRYERDQEAAREAYREIEEREFGAGRI
jgi:TRAP-type C4-dicarboxylate transport system substrate-binding protein